MKEISKTTSIAVGDEKESNSTKPCTDKSSKSVSKGKFNLKRKFSSDKFSRKNPKFKGGNDFSFWNEYPELMTTAARFPWLHIAGTPVKSGNAVNVNLANVAVQNFLPIPGFQDSASSPLNLTFRQMYLDMHRKYRGIGSYQASDIAITVLCIESALQMLVEAERIYGILNHIPVRTRIQPYGLIRALGYTAAFVDGVLQNMADYRYRINRLIDLARRLPLPSGFSFFANHVSLNGFVYADSKDERADLLIFSCAAFFEYVTTGASECINGAGTAVLRQFNRGSFASYSAMLNYIETTLKTLLYDSDILRITSDFIACYGEDNMQVLSPLPEDYKVIPQYSESILLKWHCCEWDKAPNSYIAVQGTTQLTTPLFAVYQANDVVYSMPASYGGSGTATWFQAGDGMYYYGTQNTAQEARFPQHFVDTWNEMPDIETCCEAVLWKREQETMSGTSGGNTYYAIKIDHFCTELLTDLYLYRVVNGNPGTPLNVSSSYLGSGIFGASGTLMSMLSQFDWHPYLLACTPSGGISRNLPITDVCGDTDNVSLVSGTTISKILDAALLSAFKVKVDFKGGSNLN